MKPILVHLHLYYIDMLEEAFSYINNLSAYSYDLYVTVIEYNQDVIAKIKKTNPNAHIVVVENRGFDVWPFVKILQMVNLNDYSYIIKLHTKRNMHIGSSINYFNTSGSRHRDLLFDFISSKEKIKKCIDGFTADNKLGMASNYKIIVKTEKWDKASYQRSLDLLDRLRKIFHLLSEQCL